MKLRSFKCPYFIKILYVRIIINACIPERLAPLSKISKFTYEINYEAFVLFLVLSIYKCKWVSQTYTAKQLYDEHNKNRTSFESKYKNKRITVSGKIRSINPVTYYWQGAENYHTIHLTATGYENYITCQIPYKDSALLKPLKAGALLTVTGVVAPTIIDALYLNECSLENVKPIDVKRIAPKDLPLGKYNVYQNDGTGFSFQYTITVNAKNYLVNGKSGSYVYNKGSKVIRFLTGSLKGFVGIYRPFTENEQDPPTIVINAKGDVPDLNSAWRGYQYGYFRYK